MAVNITDSFAGAVNTPITSHQTDQGQSYVRPAWGASGFYGLDGNGAITDNNAGLSAMAVVDVTLSSNAYTAQGLMDAAYQALLYQVDKAATNATMYFLFFHGGVGEYICYRYTNGVQTEIFRGGAAYSPVATPRNVGLRRTGSTVELLIEGTVRASGNDAAPLAGAGTGGFSGTGMESFTLFGSADIVGGGGGNSAPIITSNGGGATAAISVAENSTAITTVTASDVDGNTLTYSVTGGADAAKFGIDSSSGVLAFLTPPDFEIPTDADGNNQYVVIVQVSDGTAIDTQTITVTVTDVADAPAPQPAWCWMVG